MRGIQGAYWYLIVIPAEDFEAHNVWRERNDVTPTAAWGPINAHLFTVALKMISNLRQQKAGYALLRKEHPEVVGQKTTRPGAQASTSTCIPARKPEGVIYETDKHRIRSERQG